LPAAAAERYQFTQVLCHACTELMEILGVVGTLAQVAQRGGGGPIPRSIQGQIGWGSEQPGLV